MRRSIPIAILVLPLALAACAPSFQPPADYEGGFLWDGGRSRTVVAGPGDTIYSIGQRYDVPARVLVARNNLVAPYALAPGQELIIDPIRGHKVAPGETLRRIADTYDVPQSLIVEANDLQPPYTIHDGQTLWIPDPFMVAAAPLEVAMAPSAAPLRPSAIFATDLPPPPGASALPGSPGGPTMVPPPGGQQVLINPPQPDTFALTTPADPNAPLSTPVSPQPQIGPLPGAPSVMNPPQPGLPAVATPGLGLVPPMPLPPSPMIANPPQPDTAAAGTQTAMAEAQAAVPQGPPPTVAPADAKFVWPVKGRLASGFGPAGKGLHNDGINIAAPLGTQVRAVGTGTVVYAGSELKGFGNLLLIKHDNGLTTAYAHADKLLVTKGDVVKQGQVVATVGKSGNVDSPQLHFEVRRGTQAVDPQQYLRQ